VSQYFVLLYLNNHFNDESQTMFRNDNLALYRVGHHEKIWVNFFSQFMVV